MCLSLTGTMQKYVTLVCHMCLLRVFVFNLHNANICHTVCHMCLFRVFVSHNANICHTPRTELAACLDNRTLGGLNTLNTREPSCVSCPTNVCNVYNSVSHLVSMGLHTHSHCLSNNGPCNREAAVSNTILGSVYCWSDKYIFTFCVLVFFTWSLLSSKSTKKASALR